MTAETQTAPDFMNDPARQVRIVGAQAIRNGFTESPVDLRFYELVARPIADRVAGGHGANWEAFAAMTILDRHLRNFANSAKGTIPYKDVQEEYRSKMAEVILRDAIDRQPFIELWTQRTEQIAAAHEAPKKPKLPKPRRARSDNKGTRGNKQWPTQQELSALAAQRKIDAENNPGGKADTSSTAATDTSRPRKRSGRQPAVARKPRTAKEGKKTNFKKAVTPAKPAPSLKTVKQPHRGNRN